MRSQTYGDKQREAQQRKKQEELRKKSNPGVSPTTETPKADADNMDPASKKTEKKDTPDRRSA